MPRILFLALNRPNRSPGQRFRFEQYFDFLKQNGFTYEFSYLLDAADDTIFYGNGNFFKKVGIVIKSFWKRLQEINSAKNYDIIFVQRECFMLGTSFFEKQFSKSSKMIFDFDDSIWLPNVSDANKAFAWLKNPSKTADIIACADVIIAGNTYLKNYALQYNKNVVIIPTTIDTHEYQKLTIPKPDKITIGWSGSVTTIQHFEHTLAALTEVKQKYGENICIKVIGDGKYKHKELGITGLAWNKETEIAELSSFDIGIMPLPDDEWSKGKCGLKGLQYMALEIATIMSPVGVNTEIIDDGKNGFLASTHEEWVQKLSCLIESPELRAKIGQAGRKTVVEHYSVDANKEKYLQIFRQVLDTK